MEIMELLTKMFEEKMGSIKGIVTTETYGSDIIVGKIRYDVYENPSFSYVRWIDDREWSMLKCSEDFRLAFVSAVIYDIEMGMLSQGMDPSDYWEV